MVRGAQPTGRGRGVERSSQRSSSHSTPDEGRPSTVPSTPISAPQISVGLTDAGSSHVPESLHSSTAQFIVPVTQNQYDFSKLLLLNYLYHDLTNKFYFTIFK